MPNNKSSDAASTFGSLLIIRGVVAILFGIIALAWPGLTVATLALFVMIWLVITGIVLLIEAFSSIRTGGWSWILKIALATLQIGVGAYLVQRPALAIGTLIALIALVLVVQGATDVIVALTDSNSFLTEKMLWIVFGVLYIIAGITIWQYPVQGGLAFVWILGLTALVTGPIQIAAGIDINNAANRIPRTSKSKR
jgi:uncharacterized membrane protein HdeD (DUF308 family)